MVNRTKKMTEKTMAMITNTLRESRLPTSVMRTLSIENNITLNKSC